MSIKNLLFCFIFLSLPLFSEEPWGKDSDLIRQTTKNSSPKKQTLPSSFAKSIIRFHQTWISPADGPRSHYVPSSSQYTFEAIEKYGFFQGAGMGFDRLMRENDEEWRYQKIQKGDSWWKYDPVP